MIRDKEEDNAYSNYLGHCRICNKFEAIGYISGLCSECKIKQKEENNKK